MASLPGDTDLRGRPDVVLRVAGGSGVGFGHVGRCLAIWEELGSRAAFAVDDPGIVETLVRLGVPVVPNAGQARTVVLDMALPSTLHDVAGFQAAGSRVCLVDDPGAGRELAELTVDPPTGLVWPPAAGRRLAGFKHVLLRRDVRAAAVMPMDDVEIVLAFGGSDPEGLTAPLSRMLTEAGVSVLSILGPTYRGPRPSGDVLENSPEWPRALAGAALLITRFGHTVLEAAHLGTPALVVAGEGALAEAEHLAAEGTSVAVGLDPGNISRVANVALDLFGDQARRAAMSARGPALVDGQGAARVVAAMEALA